MKVFDDVKEHRKILNLEVKCMNKWKMPFGGAFNSCLSTCDWTGQLRVYEVICVWEYPGVAVTKL